MFRNAIPLFSVSGIRIRLDPTWFVIAFLLIWSLSSSFFPSQLPALSRDQHLVLATLAALGFFTSLVLHELAHALVAKRLGLDVGSITLFLFGGVAELEHEPASPASEFWIAIAGPLASIVLAGLFLGLQASIAAAGVTTPMIEVLGYLGYVNAVIAIFNMVPAFPLDGGRVLRAAVWGWSGNLMRATRIAAGAGVLFGIVLVVGGLLAVFTAGVVGGLWLVLLGSFLVMIARGSVSQMVQRELLRGGVVADFMSRDPVTVSPHDDLAAVAAAMLDRHATFLPVVDGDRVLGSIPLQTVRKRARKTWETTRAGDVMDALGEDNRIEPDVPVSDLFERMGREGRRKFVVAGEDARLLGVVTLTDLVSYLAVATGLGHDAEGQPVARRIVERRKRDRCPGSARGTDREGASANGALGLG